MKKILIPLPDNDFDLTEVAVPWHFLTQAGHQVTFATEQGGMAHCDPKLITGVLLGQLGAEKEAIQLYCEMEKSREFKNPIKYTAIVVAEYDLLHLPGGHAAGMKQYLESTVLQQKVAEFFRLNKTVGSICHGAVVLARTVDKQTGKSVVHDYQLTGLIKFLEKLAYYLTFWKHGKYYRTYPIYVEDEVKSILENPANFKQGPSPFKPFVCVDRNLITARWPKDAYLYSQQLLAALHQ